GSYAGTPPGVITGTRRLDIQAEEGRHMSKVIELSDEQYRTVEQAAARRGQTPDALLASLIHELRDRHREPRYYETDEWLRHLGMSDETIRRIEAEVKAEAETDADTR